MAESLYGDITMRQFGDLDILVRLEDALKARNVLIANRYEPEIKLSDKQFAIYKKNKDELAFVSEKDTVIVELHWELKGRNSFSPVYLELFESRLETVDFEGREVYNLPPEELLLYLCIHGAKHYWDSLDWICCVAELIQSGQGLNWRRVTQMARRVKCERILFLGLFLAHDLLCADLPAEILRYVEVDSNVCSLAEDVYVNLFQENKELTGAEICNRFSSFHIKVRDRLSDQIRSILQIAVCPTKKDWSRFPLPARPSFMRYLIRPTRLLLELLVVLFKKCFRIKDLGIPHKIEPQNYGDRISHGHTQTHTDSAFLLPRGPQYDLPDLRGRLSLDKTVIASRYKTNLNIGILTLWSNYSQSIVFALFF